MRSTFHGLETARRAMFTQQTALHTTGHNIANANTPGYSRQRVNFSQTEPYPRPGFNRPNIPGQLGTGVEAGAIQRVREGFLDMQYRAENSKYGYWDARFTALEKMEDIMNEPTDDGLAQTLDRFWTSLQDLSVHPEDSGARSVVRQRGLAVAETFNYTADSLKAIQRDLKSQLDVSVDEVNSLTRQINNINNQIASVEPHGYLPNDLYDQRDQLIDRLSTIVNIKVEPVESGGQALEIAEGKYTIKLIDENGLDLGLTLVDGKRLEANEMRIAYDDASGLVKDVYFASPKALEDPNFNYETSGGVSKFTVEDFRAVGKMKADLEAYGYLNKAGEEKGVYPKMLHDLDQMVYTFVEEFNAVHRSGWNLNEIEAGQKSDAPIDFFEYREYDPTAAKFKGAASNLTVSADIMGELNNIAASASSAISTISDRMQSGGVKDGPIVSGIYTGSYSAPPANELLKELYVKWDDTNSNWHYAITNEPDASTVAAGDWIEISSDTVNINGIKIDLSSLGQQTADKGWHLTLENGAKNEGFSGDGSNALALANVKDTTINFGGTTTNVQSFYQGVIGDMAVNTNEAERMTRNADTLRTSVNQRRESVSAVSIDEEMTNLIQFQQAYNAAARTITMVDEMLDRIINGMGAR